MKNICPICGTILKIVPGIGRYCPNEKCCVLDNIDQAMIDPKPFIDRNERLKRYKPRGISIKRRIEFKDLKCIPSRANLPQECSMCGHMFKPHELMEMMPEDGKIYIEIICIRCAIANLYNEREGGRIYE